MALLKNKVSCKSYSQGIKFLLDIMANQLRPTTSFPLFRFLLVSHFIELNGWIFFFRCVHKMIESLTDLRCFNRYFPFTLISTHMLPHFLLPLLIHSKCIIDHNTFQIGKPAFHFI